MPITAYSSGCLGSVLPGSVLLMHFNNSFADSAVGHKVTTNGAVSIDAVNFQFGPGSVLFNAAGQSLTLDGSSDFNFGLGDFTVDFWFRMTALSAAVQSLIDFDDVAGNFSIQIDTDESLRFHSPGGQRNTPSSFVTIGAWNHAAVTRASSLTRFFFNGRRFGPIFTDHQNYTALAGFPIIGSSSIGEDFNGNIDELRIIKGFAAYTFDFTPPVAPYVS